MSDLDLFPYPVTRLGKIDIDLASSLRTLVEKEVMARRLEHKEDYDQVLRPSLKKTLAGVGLQRMFWPEAAGGEGHDKPAAAYTIVAALEQIGRADTGLAFLAAHNLALQAAMVLHGAEQVDSFANLFCETEEPVIVSFVLPAYGDDEEAPQWRGKYPQVTASSGKDGWLLEGKGVRPTCSGVDADLFGVVCAVKGEDETAFILVPGDAPGLERGDEIKKTGLSASRNTEIAFGGVEVPAASCAWRGEEGLRRLLSWYYLGLTGALAGGLLAVYEIIKEWGDTRVIKGRGQIFKENLLTSAIMGEVAQAIALNRLLAYDLAGILAEPETFGDSGSEAVFVSASMIAHHVCGSADSTIYRTMELMASAGYAKEWQLERYWRDIKTVQCYLGAAELAKHDYARWFYQTKTL
jgi:alkylation response protein AidB-like acyl-CoA dehydrogenase